MNGKVNGASEKRFLEFLGEKTLVERANGVQRNVEPIVPNGPNDPFFDLKIRVRGAECGRDHPGLSEGERAAAGAEGDRVHGIFSPRIRSSWVCRLRMTFHSEPSTRTSGGMGREL